MDIKIGKAVEKEALLEAEKSAQEAVRENAATESSEMASEISSGLGLDGKTIGITAAVLVGLFLVASFGLDLFSGADSFTSAVVANVDELHDSNMEGTLDAENGYMHNGFSFVLHDGLWWTEIVKTNAQGQGIERVKTQFHYGPRDVSEVTFTGMLDASFDSQKEVYLTIDPTVVNKYYTLSLSEMNFNIVEGIGRMPVGACMSDAPECVGREIVSCDNNPEGLPVIEMVLSEGSTGEIEFLGSCVRLTGDDETLVQAADRWLLHWYSIMPLEGLEITGATVAVDLAES